MKRQTRLTSFLASQRPKTRSISSFIEETKVKWVEKDSLLIYNTIGQFTEDTKLKIASFDLDFTIISTLSPKRRFPKDEDDWKFLFSNVESKLKEIDGVIVIFTNQLGLELNHRKKVEFKKKIENIFSILQIPMLLIASLENNYYRKPSIGMWEWMTKEIFSTSQIDIQNSFYVGDAAGRPANWKDGKLKDHSEADRNFATNLQVTFMTPEVFFLKDDPKYHLSGTPPNQHPSSYLGAFEWNYPTVERHLLLMVGPPCCGKNTFYKKFLEPFYSKISESSLRNNDFPSESSCVLIGCNPTKIQRSSIFKMLSSCKIPIIALEFTNDTYLSNHLNRFKSIKDCVDLLPKFPFINWNSFYEECSLSEGFQSIIKVPSKRFSFNTKEEESLFLMHL